MTKIVQYDYALSVLHSHLEYLNDLAQYVDNPTIIDTINRRKRSTMNAIALLEHSSTAPVRLVVTAPVEQERKS